MSNLVPTDPEIFCSGLLYLVVNWYKNASKFSFKGKFCNTFLRLTHSAFMRK